MSLGKLLRPCAVSALLLATTALAGGPESVWLTAEDGVKIRGDLYPLDGDEKKVAPLILLFHQAGSNRGEYSEIAPRLNALGFNALAIDQRSGGTRWGYDNETVKKLGDSADYLDALPDLEAALAWAATSGYEGTTIAWGSSYSSSLVLLLAAEHETIDAVLSFSPGEYLGKRGDEVRRAARKVRQPVLSLTPEDERKRASLVIDAVPGDDAVLIIPEQAVHGSSMLVPSRNPGADAIWPEVEKFLGRFTD